MPGRLGWRCQASLTLAVETCSSTVRTSAAPARLYSVVSMQTRSSTARRISAVAAVASADLVIAPPTTTMPAPASTAAAAVSLLMPPAAETGITTASATARSGVERRLAAHLLVDGRVDADVVGAELLGALRARHGVGDLDHVDDELAAVVARRLGALLDRAVGRGAEHADHAGSGLGGVLHLGAAGVHRLHVGDDGLVGELGLQGPDGVQALGLDQRRAGLDPVGAAGDGLARDLEGARQVDEVERDLDERALLARVAVRGDGGAARSIVSHTPITCTTTDRSRGRASKSQNTMFW